ncbi:MAG: HD domain-containing protein [Proteobacteria bacterium]|nr:HD domain-containing protein [Pseudomonadota bacterium]
MNPLREILSKNEWHEISKLNDVVQNEDWIWAMCCTIYCPNDQDLSAIFRFIASEVIRRAGIGQIQSGGEDFPFGTLISQWCEQYMKSNAWDSEVIDFCEKMRVFSRTLDGQTDSHLKSFLGLGNVPRSGWMRVIPELKNKSGESVAQHSIKTAFYAGCLCREAFAELFLMGLVHDHAELVVGDLTPEQVHDRSEKIRSECCAYRRMIDETELPDAAAERLWRAFETCMTDASSNAHCLHLADKIDMALQALSYEQCFHVDLQEFLDSTATVLMDNAELEIRN